MLIGARFWIGFHPILRDRIAKRIVGPRKVFAQNIVFCIYFSGSCISYKDCCLCLTLLTQD